MNSTYFPLVEYNKYWSELQIVYTGWPPGTDSVYHTYKFRLLGDTIINQILYTKVYKQDLYYGHDWYYYSAIREDYNGKVLMWDEGEKIIYDFSAMEGDTVHVNMYFPLSMYVEEVDSVLIGANYRKRLHLTYLYCHEVWIEGLGSNYGLFMVGGGEVVGGAYRNLCVHDENGLVYMNPNYTSCEMTNVSVPEEEMPDISFYPNPSTDVIKLQGKPQGEFEFHVYDVSGKLMNHGTILTGNPIDVSKLRNGIYFVSFTSQNKRQVFKLIKQ